MVDKQKLNPKLFDLSVDQEAIRSGFGEGLLEAAKQDDRIVGLCADLTESTKMNLFRDEFPDRFIQIGVAEQNLATVASGLAAMGKIPFITSYAMFSPGRNWEQIRTTICYNDQNVKIIGSHAGVSVGPDGGTHQAVEDIAITRVIPRMTVVAPADAIEARKATLAIAKKVGPAYIRLAREKTPIITTDESPFVLGRANLLWQTKQPRVLIVAAGNVVYQALMAAQKLSTEDFLVNVLNMHTIKPLDEDTLIEQAKLAGAVVTVEEHQRAGGLGGAVTEVLAWHWPVPIRRLGVDDKFGQSGQPNQLLEHYGLSPEDIIQAAKEAARRRVI